MDEKLLIRKVLKGDTSSFGYFVDTYQNMAINIAYRICSNRQDAEDIVQNSFVKAFHNLQTFRIDGKFSTWFYRIVFNTCLTHINSPMFYTEHADYQELETNESHLEILSDIYEKERKEIINKAMDQMPKDDSLILTLFYLEENSIKDISYITCLSESNIKVKLHRSRKRLKDILASIIKKEKMEL